MQIPIKIGSATKDSFHRFAIHRWTIRNLVQSNITTYLVGDFKSYSASACGDYEVRILLSRRYNLERILAPRICKYLLEFREGPGIVVGRLQKQANVVRGSAEYLDSEGTFLRYVEGLTARNGSQ